MIRIFTVLAITNLFALIATFSLGWTSVWTGSRADPDGTIYMAHFLFGLFTAVSTLLVHCLIFTYFLGTGRWVREVSIAYGLPDAPLYKTTRELKRKTFPPALFAMLGTMAAAAIGGGVQLQGWSWILHFSAACIAIFINLWGCWVEWKSLRVNEGIIAEVYREVDRVRRERGLPTNEEAWQMEQAT